MAFPVYGDRKTDFVSWGQIRWISINPSGDAAWKFIPVFMSLCSGCTSSSSFLFLQWIGSDCGVSRENYHEQEFEQLVQRDENVR